MNYKKYESEPVKITKEIISLEEYCKKENIDFRTAQKLHKERKIKFHQNLDGSINVEIFQFSEQKKKCSGCLLEKRIDNYIPRKRGKYGVNHICNECRKIERKDEKIKKPESYIKGLEKRKKTNKIKNEEIKNDPIAAKQKKNRATNWFLIRKYNITLKQYEDLLKSQNYKCAICHCENNNKDKKCFDVDHCHETGKVRGLLCNSCNQGIGYINKSEHLKSAAEYVFKHENSQLLEQK